MPTLETISITLDRQFLEHPKALHLRRVRSAIWLYLAILGRLAAAKGSIDLDPKEMAGAMGLPEGTIRSWLGHLRKGGYLRVQQIDGRLTVSRPIEAIQPEAAVALTPIRRRFFTAAKLVRALGDAESVQTLEAAIEAHPDTVVRDALARALAVPQAQIRRSRTALFLYFLKQHAHEQTSD